MRTNIVIDDQLVADAMKLPFLNPAHPIKTWEAAAEIYMRCRQQGYTPPGAVSWRSNGYSGYSRDELLGVL